MSLKTEPVTVPAWGGRDDGKVFEITEMPSGPAEKWALRMFIVIKGTQGYVPDEVAERLGIVGVALRGLNAFLAADVEWAKLEPLLDEMFTCVKRIRDPRAHPEIASPLIASDIEEVGTRMWLRGEVLRVHTGFSFAEAMSKLLLMTSAISKSAGSPNT